MASARHKLAGSPSKILPDVENKEHRADDPHDPWGAAPAEKSAANDDPHDPWIEEAIRQFGKK